MFFRLVLTSLCFVFVNFATLSAQLLQNDSTLKSPLGYLGSSYNLSLAIQKISSVSDANVFPVSVHQQNKCMIYIGESLVRGNSIEKKDILCSCTDSLGNLILAESILTGKNYLSCFEKGTTQNVLITLNQDIYSVTKDENGNNKYLKLNINTKYYEGNATLSPDGNTLYFSSNRKGGFGGKDIYTSEKKSDGTWSNPVNLGAKINTSFDEESPFIMNDGVTLYFSSNGHGSFGGYDIFTSTLSDDGYWSDIENLGFSINSDHDELNYISDKYGKTGYFASDKEISSHFEMYSVKY